MSWTIEVKNLPLVGVSGHLYLEIFDGAGNRVLQVNGLATNPATQKPRDIGLPGDFLKAYVSNTQILSDTIGATRDNHPHKGTVLFRGTQQDIAKAIKAIEKAADQINKLNLRYNFLLQNSNSVFMHIVDVLSDVIPIDFPSLEAARGLKPIFPGINKQIAGRGGYQSMKERFNAAAAKKRQDINKKNFQPKP